MKKNMILILFAFGLLFPACSKKSETPAEAPATDNPFFAEYDTPYKVPPFDIIKPEHFVPAYEKGMEQQKAEIEQLVSNCLLYTSPSPRDRTRSRMPSSA